MGLRQPLRFQVESRVPHPGHALRSSPYG